MTVSHTRASARARGRAAATAALILGGATVATGMGRPEAPPAAGAAQACAFVPARAEGVPPVAREFRAAWISPVEDGEWPSSPELDDAEQRQELVDLLDRAAAIGLNAVILHVRPSADALYPTTRAPWSSYLVPAGEQQPAYDPIAFALAEAHRRGLQLHLWFNPFRAAPPEPNRPAVGAAALAATHPDWVVRYGSQQWIDPGDPGARQAVLNAILEVAYRYDVDGVHLDDYFYPYLEDRTTSRRVRVGRRWRTVRQTETLRFPDDRTWQRYGQAAGWADRGDWRRENVSSFVHALYDSVKKYKPAVLVGISPFGIWRPGYPSGVTGLDAYSEIYADSRRWWRQGWVDYLAPQLYWTLDGEQARDLRLDAWWRAENVHGRHLWPGMLTMRVASGAHPWPATEIERQIGALRSARAGSGESQGHIHFRLKSLLEEAPGGLGNVLNASMYATRALPPASPWLGAAAPAAPRVAACADGAQAAVTVASGGGVAPRWWYVQWRDAVGRWSARTLPAASAVVPARYGDGSAPTAIAVRAISATGVESEPLVLTAAPAATVGGGR